MNAFPVEFSRFFCDESVPNVNGHIIEWYKELRHHSVLKCFQVTPPDILMFGTCAQIKDDNSGPIPWCNKLRALLQKLGCPMSSSRVQ